MRPGFFGFRELPPIRGNFVVVVAILIAAVAVSLTQAQTSPFVYMQNRTRPATPAVVIVYPTGAAWAGPPDPKPHVPGNKEILDAATTGLKALDRCKDYRDQNRGIYMDNLAAGARRFYYPFQDWAKSCDFKKFLWCEGTRCKCFPGMYWNDTTSKCDQGFGHACTHLSGYDFLHTRRCGVNLQCQDGTCACHPNLANVVYLGPNVTDGFENPKLTCDIPPSLVVGNPCDEFMASQWAPVPGRNDSWVKENVTKTGCGDIFGSYEINFYCHFPAEQTGPNPSLPYGARRGGTCGCTDPAILAYRTGKGCFPRVGTVCDEETGLVHFIGKDPMNHTLAPISSNCGVDANCTRAVGADNATCHCNPGVRLDMEGFCDSTTSFSVGSDKHVNDTCTVDVEDDPCFLEAGQVCVNGTCVCKKGYATNWQDLVCDGLYGVQCEVNNCLCGTEGMYDCAEVPELALLHEAVFPNTRYCVCKNDYLFTGSGRCVGCWLSPQNWLLLLVVALGISR